MYPVIDPIQTGANIARLRKAAGLTIRQLQDGLGVTAQAVRNGAICLMGGLKILETTINIHFSVLVAWPILNDI